MEKFIERFNFLRTEILKISMNELGKSLNTNASAISKYENGESKPGYEFIKHLCETFGISANWLVLNIGPIKLSDINDSYIDTASINAKADKDLEYKISQAISLLEEVKLQYNKTNRW